MILKIVVSAVLAAAAWIGFLAWRNPPCLVVNDDNGGFTVACGWGKLPPPADPTKFRKRD